MLIAVTILMSVIALSLNVASTRRTASSELYSSSQKRNQLLLIWLVPFVGSILVLWVGRFNSEPVRREKEVGNDPAVTDQQAIDFGLAPDD